jgi:hypothetical protein
MTQRQRASMHGYEAGSVAARFTPEQRRAFKRWLHEADEDCRAVTKPYRNPAAAKR